MKLKIKELGYGLISILLFQIAFSIVSLKTSINFLELKNYTDISYISAPQQYSEILVSSLIIISILIFIIRKKAGLILYIFTILLSTILSIFFTNVTLSSLLISLIIPAITLILIYIKRDVIF